MGWTGFPIKYSGYNERIDVKKELESEIFMSSDIVLKSRMVGSTYYAAIKDYYSGEVVGLVVLTSVSNESGMIHYKQITEYEGPGYYDCPESILKLLSPTDNKYSLQWRERCRNHLKAKKGLNNLPIGSIIECTFYSGDKIKLIKRGPAYQFKKDWYQVVGKFGFYHKKDIPDEWRLVEE